MRIGIDISQIVHEGTGVAMYVRQMVNMLLKTDRKNEYVLFGASLRKRDVFKEFSGRAKLVVVPIPPTLLAILWNVFHIIPVERFVGNVDIFWSSDWTQPPLAHAKGITTIHDLTILKFPKEMDAGIVATQKKRLSWAAHECDAFFCDSIATKKDVSELLKISEDKLHVIYPGVS